MTIELKNFGPIDYFKFDLTKDLHAIFGKNNIGKSYALSSVYLIIKCLIQARISRGQLIFENGQSRLYWGIREDSPVFEKLLLKVKDTSNQTISVHEEIANEILGLLNKDLIFDLNQSFQNSFSFDSIQNKYTESSLEIIISNEQFELSAGLNQKTNKLVFNRLNFKQIIQIKKINSNRKSRNSDSTVTLYYNLKMDTIQDIQQCFLRFLNKILSSVSSLVTNVYFLPASRSGLYNALSTFGAIMAELSQSRNFVKAKFELPNISEPVSDYFLNLSSVKASKAIHDFTEIAQEIEADILKGRVSFNSKTKKFSYQPANLEIDLDLSVTSSMISEIAPIVAHLKFILASRPSRPGKNLLFIEEPEAHLHPEIQIKLIEIFSRLIDKNVKVVMTSHSNYIFNKLSNLIIGQKISPERIQVGLMEMGSKGSRINETAMAVDEYGIEDQNFADVAEDLYEERIKLIDNLNSED